MQDLLKAVDGYKVYIGVGIAAVVIVLNHFGVPIPGVTRDPNAWLQDLWALYLAASAKSAIAKAGTGT